MCTRDRMLLFYYICFFKKENVDQVPYAINLLHLLGFF
jgi:hypothetical protein